MSHILVPPHYGFGFKVEVGSGMNPQPGYYHVDIDPHMPDLHAVCRMGVEPLPLEDNKASELLSNHSIEHVSWLSLPFLLGDWFRVLKPGGRLFFRTPDLEFICRTYLEGKTTPEANEDEQSMERIFGQCGPGEWANIKLFAGQSYAGNFHFFALDWDMCYRLLERHGYVKIKRLHIPPVFSPGEIQCEAYKPE